MASKTISVTEEVYEKLAKVKGDDESFSQFFLRLLNLYHQNLEKSFGAWNLTPEEKDLIWKDLISGTLLGRKWSHP